MSKAISALAAIRAMVVMILGGIQKHFQNVVMILGEMVDMMMVVMILGEIQKAILMLRLLAMAL